MIENTKENVAKLLKAMRETRMSNLENATDEEYKASLLREIPIFNMVIDLLTEPYEFDDYAKIYSEIWEEGEQSNG